MDRFKKKKKSACDYRLSDLRLFAIVIVVTTAVAAGLRLRLLLCLLLDLPYADFSLSLLKVFTN